MSIYCKIGTVNSQKTTNLLAAAKSYDLQNRKILCIKPSADTRDVGVIKSRVGLERECYTLEPESEALSKIIVEYSEKNNVDHVDAIFIDEGQFLSEENVKEIIVLSAEYNFNFLVYGLTSTYTGQPFISMTTLMIFAKDIEEISNTLCTYCHSKSKMNLKVVDGKPVFEGDIVSVDEELYEPQYVPVCPKCFTKKMLEEYK